MFFFGSKADTLEYLFRNQHTFGASVLPLRSFEVKMWKTNADDIWRTVDAMPACAQFIVRSSAKAEDTVMGSLAGKFDSKACNRDKDSFFAAVQDVIASYGEAGDEDQFFVQPLLEKVDSAGVAFSLEPNGGGSYYVIDFDESGSTSSVTSGMGKGETLFYWFKGSKMPDDVRMRQVCQLLQDLETLCGTDRLDIEFAFAEDVLYLFQARPLCANHSASSFEEQRSCIGRIKKYIRSEASVKPFLYGRKAIFSNMTDWNPAEMIGIHPRPLALSLYKELITDNIWAYQRDNYGYMNLRSFPLLIDFCGYPYIDARLSFNSFIPADLDARLAEKLVNYYLDRLEERPENHDKAEFNIVFSCYTFDLPKRLQILRRYGFTAEEIETITVSLRRLTNRIVNSHTGLWRQDAEKIRKLERRQNEIRKSGLDDVGRMYWLIEDCKRYGTLPFAGLARAAFIAVQLLQSMVSENILTKDEYEAFLSDVQTVGSRMKNDFFSLAKEDFLARYGHLRPGTYDITSLRYDEAPDLYFRWDKQDIPLSEEPICFRLSLEQLERVRSALHLHGLDDDVLGMFGFIKSAIESRESAKFVFTRSLSEFLRLFGCYGEKHHHSRDDCSYANVALIRELYASTRDQKQILEESIQQGRRRYEQGKSLVLPPLLVKEEDAESFLVPDSQPTFITQKRVKGEVCLLTGIDYESLDGRIVVIPSADPGFDWIFSYEIAGFMTEYGGANSHMAIRAGELQIPAVIGAGEKLFARIQKAKMIEIDAALKTVTILQ